MKKWTKKNLRELTGHLDSFWLSNRPLDIRSRGQAEIKLREFLAVPRNREEAVLAGLRAARARHAERYKSNCEVIGNQLVRFTKYGEPDELVERFTKLAREEDSASRKAEELLHRVLKEGLPPEVVAYDPTVYWKR